MPLHTIHIAKDTCINQACDDSQTIH